MTNDQNNFAEELAQSNFGFDPKTHRWFETPVGVTGINLDPMKETYASSRIQNPYK